MLEKKWKNVGMDFCEPCPLTWKIWKFGSYSRCIFLKTRLKDSSPVSQENYHIKNHFNWFKFRNYSNFRKFRNFRNLTALQLPQLQLSKSVLNIFWKLVWSWRKCVQKYFRITWNYGDEKKYMVFDWELLIGVHNCNIKSRSSYTIDHK